MTTPNDPNGRRKKSREVGYAPWKPYKAGQRRLTQILVVEAAGAVQQVASTTKPYGITTRSGSGFNTITSLREAALRAADRTVPTTILVVGDYDPTGEDIRARVADDVGAFAAAHDATFERYRIRAASDTI
jgi:hypothetical protein